MHTDDPALVTAIYDLKRLFALREAVETLELSAPPTVRVISSQTETRPLHVGILCGSFNPLTLAHTELAAHAIAAFALDQVFFTLAKVTVDKERVTGMGLEDRLLLLSLYTERHPTLGVALVNRGLYFEQAQAFRALFGEQTKLSFLIGMDKLLQIFDSRYYHDRDAALQQLFGLASLIVANRGEMDEQSFSQLLDHSENRPFREHVRFFTLPETITDLSATQVRQSLAAGQPISSYVSPEVATFINETRAYHPPLPCRDQQIDAYTVRQALLTLLDTERFWAEQEVDFQRLIKTALSSSAQGPALRQARNLKEIAERLSFFSLQSTA